MGGSAIDPEKHGLPYGVECINGCGYRNIGGHPVFVLTSNGPTCLACLKASLGAL